MRIQIFSLITLWLLSNNSAGQSPACIWANPAVSGNLLTDQNNNVYVVSGFSGFITVGSNTYTSNGSNDILIVKYAPSGSLNWSLTFGGSANDVVTRSTYDNSGNLYVTGYFYSQVLTIGSDTLVNAGGPNNRIMFLAKIDTAGNIVWARGPSGGEGFAIGVCADNAGNSYVTGGFLGTAFTVGGVTITNPGISASVNTFLVKFDAAGNVLWVKKSDFPENDSGNNIHYDPSGSLVLTGNAGGIGSTGGSFSYSAQSITFSDQVLFIMKLDTTGNALWINGIFSGLPIKNHVATDGSGNIYLGDAFQNSFINFGATTLTNDGNYPKRDCFIAKYNSLGQFQWVTKIGGVESENLESLAIKGNGELMVAGSFKSPITTFNTDTLTNAGLYDGYFAKYDTSGSLIWVQGIGGANSEFVTGMAINGNNNMFYLSGEINSPIVSFGTCNLLSAGTPVSFLSKFDQTSGYIEIHQSAESLSLFPNPSSDGRLNISSASKILEVSAYDATGRTLLCEKPLVREFSFELNKPGIYLLKTITDAGTFSRKFIVLK